MEKQFRAFDAAHPEWLREEWEKTGACRTCRNFAFAASDNKAHLAQIATNAAEGKCSDCAILNDGFEKFKNRLSLDDDLYAIWNTSGAPKNQQPDILRITICKTGATKDKLLSLQFHSRSDNIENSDRVGSISEVVERPESKAALRCIQDWTSECFNSHRGCTEKISDLPKRVLDVGSGNQNPVILLYETSKERESYISLSHCWGSPKVHSLPAKTLSSNLDERQRAIPLSDLNQTFQDAVELTRRLGIRYLWIDSLCIIQDDRQDWEEQSSLMGKIYEGSHITIVATHASSGADGLFTSRKPSLPIRSNIFVREKLPHDAWFVNAVTRFDEHSEHVTLKRGWCFQEELLSTRLIHFTKHEMVWICKSTAHCECGFQERFNWAPRPGTFPTHYSYDQYNWTNIVKLYSATHFTEDTDRLPALSALASKIHKQTEDIFLAGIWKSTAVRNLGWFASGMAHRPLKYIAPSFSWAAIIGKVTYALLHMLEEHDELLIHAQLLDGKCEPTSLDPFGAIYDGAIRLRGPLLPASVVTISDPGQDDSKLAVKFKPWSRRPTASSRPRETKYVPPLERRNVQPMASDSMPKQGWHSEYQAPVNLDTRDDLHLALKEQVYCVPLYSIDKTYREWDEQPILAERQECFNCLAALLLIESSPGSYRRIGLSHTMGQVLIEEDFCLTNITIK